MHLLKRRWVLRMYGSIHFSTKASGHVESEALPIEFVLNWNVSLISTAKRRQFLTLFTHTGKRNDEENAKEKLYTYASYVATTSFKVGHPASHVLFVISHLAGSWDSDRRYGVNSWCLAIPSFCPLCTTYVSRPKMHYSLHRACFEIVSPVQ